MIRTGEITVGTRQEIVEKFKDALTVSDDPLFNIELQLDKLNKFGMIFYKTADSVDEEGRKLMVIEKEYVHIIEND